MSRINFFIILFLLVSFTGKAQKFKYTIPGLDTISQSFLVSGGASAVLSQGQAEVIFYNSLTSFWLAFYENGKTSPIIDRMRNTTFTSDLSAFYGISRSGRFDIGLQVNYTRTRLDNSAGNSPFKIFEKEIDFSSEEEFEEPLFRSSIRDNSFGGIANAGIRFRFKPIAYKPGLLFTGGYTHATIKDTRKQRQLASERNFMDLGISYYKSMTPNIYYFFQTGLRSFFPSKLVDEFPGSLPDLFLHSWTSSFFLIHRTGNQKFTFYPGFSYTMDFQSSRHQSPPLIRSKEFLLAYGGIQYALSAKNNLFFVAGLPLFIKIVNPSVDFVRESYSVTVLGARFGI